MVELQTETTYEKLTRWFTMSKELKALKSAESMLRRSIFDSFFPTPKEGTNSADIPDGEGYVLKGKYSLNREIDEGGFTASKAVFREAGINPDVLVKYKPSLVKVEYNKLTEEQKKLFDQVLIIKPSSPAMEIVLPAKAKAAKAAEG